MLSWVSQNYKKVPISFTKKVFISCRRKHREAMEGDWTDEALVRLEYCLILLWSWRRGRRWVSWCRSCGTGRLSRWKGVMEG